MHQEPICMTIKKLIDSEQAPFFQFIWRWTTILKKELCVLHQYNQLSILEPNSNENSTQKVKKSRANWHYIFKRFIIRTWGISSFTGSFTNFSGELRADGPTLCFMNRGEPDKLLGESGGVLPAGNIEGKELLVTACVLDDVPETFKGPPPFTLLSNDFTYNLQIVVS